MKRNGFTLIEVLISIMIVGFISLFTARSIRQGVQFKGKLQGSLDQRTALNNAMKIIERDINLAFHYQDFYYDLDVEMEKAKYEAEKKKAEEDAKKNGTTSVFPPFVSKLKPLKQLTQFLGSENKLDFTNLNNIRVSENSQQSDQQEVGYFLKNCESVMKPELKGQCLWRRTSPYIDDKVDEGGDENVVLEGVQKFELRYFGKGKEDWYKEWKTNESGDDITKDNFPLAVEVSLSTEWKEKGAEKGKTMSAIRVVPLRFPNNKEKTDPNAADAPGGVNGGAGGTGGVGGD